MDLFEHPEADTLEELDFKAFMVPEAMVGSPFYNPLSQNLRGTNWNLRFFFGYSTHTTEDIEHISANQDHINEVEQHVELAEKFA